MASPATTTLKQGLELVETNTGWVLTSDSNRRYKELLYEIEDRLSNNEIGYQDAARRLDGALAKNPDWLQGMVLRAMVAEMIGDIATAEKHCRAVHESVFDLITRRTVTAIDTNSNENRAFLRASNRHIENLRRHRHYGNAADAMLQMMEITGASHPGLPHDLGPTLLRAGRTDEAIRTLKKHAANDPACLYELGLIAFENKEFEKAATHLRQGAAQNPEIAEMLMGLKNPGPTALWTRSNLYDAEGAAHYHHHWGQRWIGNTEARDFLRWLYTHPQTCRERAEAQNPREAMYWEQNAEKRRTLIKTEQLALDRIDTRLSKEIVIHRYNGREIPDYPWRVLRAAHTRHKQTISAV